MTCLWAFPVTPYSPCLVQMALERRHALTLYVRHLSPLVKVYLTVVLYRWWCHARFWRCAHQGCVRHPSPKICSFIVGSLPSIYSHWLSVDCTGAPRDIWSSEGHLQHRFAAQRRLVDACYRANIVCWSPREQVIRRQSAKTFTGDRSSRYAIFSFIQHWFRHTPLRKSESDSNRWVLHWYWCKNETRNVGHSSECLQRQGCNYYNSSVNIPSSSLKWYWQKFNRFDGRGVCFSKQSWHFSKTNAW